ncbi:hypothetical protein G7Y31_03800 [Corynebacterium lizhenjunii]|uniref:Uncharacterized protein n=1 Tax=Corynebacterium lizhenjunii TaxID=2709394 RepID=A0A7T0PBU4_9CORY|nr:hypothetical protein [Corynebacterium lizhenjunii]QPK79830.1 hypothetical protein G7Y31_03800 [Corynebacterium lizhenjunii]
MSLFSRTPRLASTARSRKEQPVAHLAVHPAGEMIIIVTSPDGAQALRTHAAAGQAITLTHGSTRVHLTPQKRADIPVHSPTSGWIIALTPAEQRQLATLPDSGDAQLSSRLAVSVEAPATN